MNIVNSAQNGAVLQASKAAVAAAARRSNGPRPGNADRTVTSPRRGDQYIRTEQNDSGNTTDSYVRPRSVRNALYLVKDISTPQLSRESRKDANRSEKKIVEIKLSTGKKSLTIYSKDT